MVCAAKKDFSQFKIISAEKLDYQDGNSTLIGNVKIKIDNFTIAAPQAFIDSDINGEPSLARFVGGVILDSDQLSIEAPRMNIDTNKSLLMSYANQDTLVITHIYGKKQAKLFSEYQEINLATGLAKAGLDPCGNGFLAQVKYLSEDLSVESDSLELEIKELSEVKYIDFLNHVVAISDQLRVESQELLYFPTKNLIKANDDVKILFLNEEQASYLFADSALFEEKKNILSVFSTSLERYAEIHSDQLFGKARQILVNINEDQSIDNAVFTGNAYAQHQSKSVLGHEILFDVKKQTLKTLVGRPRTRLLK